MGRCTIHQLAKEKKNKIKTCKTSVISFIHFQFVLLISTDGPFELLIFDTKSRFANSGSKLKQKVSKYIMIHECVHLLISIFLNGVHLIIEQFVLYTDQILWIIHQHWYAWLQCSKQYNHFWYLECLIFYTNRIKYWFKKKQSFQPQKHRFYRSGLYSVFRLLQSLSEFFFLSIYSYFSNTVYLTP